VNGHDRPKLAVSLDSRTGEIDAKEAAVLADNFKFAIGPGVEVPHFGGILATGEDLGISSKIRYDLLDILTYEIVHRVTGHVRHSLVQIADRSLIIDHGSAIGQHF
jgi:hypothetical protein